MQGLPKDKVEKVAEELAFKYPPWFFELYSELEGKPLILEDYQIRYLLDDNTFKVVNKSRQTGGSLMVAMKKFYRAYRNPYYKCSIISINLKEAIDKIRYIRAIHDSLPMRYKIPLAVDNATAIGFHKGSRLSFVESIAASAAVRGSRKEVVFDEFAHIKQAEDLFYAAAPAMLNGDLTLDVISTPKGNIDLFSQMWKNEKNHMGDQPYSVFTRHQFIWLDAKRFVTDYEKVQQLWYQELHENMDYMNDVVRQYGTDKIKFYYHLYPWNQFLQEFCGVFLDERGAFFPQALIQKCLLGSVAKADDYEEMALEPWTSRPEKNVNQVFMGVDFGESDEDTDKTSIQILELDSDGVFWHRYSEVLNKQHYPDFPAQAEHIVDLAQRFRVTELAADDTGLGRGINPLIKRLDPNLPLTEINFNFASKEQMVMNLKSLMEHGRIWLQADDIQLQGQIRNIERKLTESGRATYHGKPHDDMFWALALAARAEDHTPFSIYQIGAQSSRSRWGL